MAAPVAPDEPQRLEALERYQVLDTPAEAVFDDIVAIAARQCHMPISLISLIDRDRQWFKARVGVEVQQTPRELAFCTHAILQRETFIVPDARIDERFSTNPLVIHSPQVRFYAGTPLVTPDNRAIGTLCVLDYQPREFPPDQQDRLWHFNRQVMMYLEWRRKLLALQQTIRTSLDTATRRQIDSDIHLLQSLTEAIQEAHDFHGALQRLLQFLCKATGWPIATAWTPSPDESVLEASPAYYVDEEQLAHLQQLRGHKSAPGIDAMELERFRGLGERLLFRPGEGLQGRIWLSRQPENWPSQAPLRSPIIEMREKVARAAGLKSGLGVPLMVEEQVLAVLVFFSWESQMPIEPLLRLMATITQLQPAAASVLS
ncbi:MAG: GAF domain-containing protein [Aphanocapsa lilacina HA4352-LM1]|jgi:GAF domain-containing protein|nr:GAF domain-containing protein [Aphanocapsa lilacina HA4352-LM1]